MTAQTCSEKREIHGEYNEEYGTSLINYSVFIYRMVYQSSWYSEIEIEYVAQCMRAYANKYFNEVLKIMCITIFYIYNL